MFGQVLLKLVVGQDDSLFKPIHSLSNLNVDVAFRVKEVFGNVVFVEEFSREIITMEAHVLVDLHGGVEEKVLEICGVQ